MCAIVQAKLRKIDASKGSKNIFMVYNVGFLKEKKIKQYLKLSEEEMIQNIQLLDQEE